MNPDDSLRRQRPDDETVVIGSELREVEAGLRSALTADAGSIQPGERLATILSRAHEGGGTRTLPSSRRPWPILAAAAAVALVTAGTLWVAGRPGPDASAPAGATRTTTSLPASRPPASATVPSTPTAPTTTGASTALPPAPAGSITGVPVYWIGETGGAPRLFREFRTVPDAGGPIASALYAMTRMQPLDADYTTPWTPASRITTTRSGSSLTVDLSADAISATDVGSEVAQRAVQQLVYTATAAASVAGTPVTSVTILVDGGPAELWGTVRVGTPTPRAPVVEVQSHVWALSPTEGQELSPGRLAFTGYGTSFEANFLWRITTDAGVLVAKGNAMGGTGDGGFGQFTFDQTLPVGRYVVEMSTEDPSGRAEGSGAQVDTKAFTVR
jgi:hypothetical protein